MPRWSGMDVRRGWFVFAQNSGDLDKAEWLKGNPDFVEWDQDWFEQECRYGFVAENVDPLEGAPVILFREKEVAEKYAKRDWHMASGQGHITPVLYLELHKDPEWDENDDEWTLTTELRQFAPDRPGGFACVGNEEILVFKDSEEGHLAILDFAREPGIAPDRIVWPA